MAKPMKTGAALRGGAIEWTTLRLRKGRVELVQQTRDVLELPGGEPDFSAEDTVAAIKKSCSGLKGELSLALPAEHTLMRVLDLPATDPEELAGMVELQVDKFSPFPVEQMAVSFEVLSVEGDVSRVLIVAAQNRYVEELGSAFQRAGLSPRRVDVEVMGWWWLFKQRGEVQEEGRHVVLLLDVSGVELIVAQGGVPLAFRSLGVVPDEPGEEWAVEVSEETSYTLTTLEVDAGGAEALRVSVWHWEELPPSLVAHLERECECEVELRKLDALPPLSEGLAYRMLEDGQPHIDLSATAWHEQEQRRALRKRLLVATAALVGVWGVSVAAFVIGFQLQHGRLQKMQNEVERVEGPAEEVRQIKEKVLELEEYADRTYSAIECLREVCEILPGGVDLNSFVYKKAREVNMRGETDPNSVNLIYDFFEALEGSELFVSIANEKVTTRTSRQQRRAEFTVRAKLPGAES